MLGQWPDGGWRFSPAALEVDRNATDLVVQAAFGCSADAPSPEEAAGPIEVLAGSPPSRVAGDGSFRAARNDAPVRLGGRDGRAPAGGAVGGYRPRPPTVR